jgi:hypothetical protein
MLRIGALSPAIAVFLIITAFQSTAQAQTATVPAYFFKQWSVQSNCAEQGADPAAHTQVGLQYVISPASISADGLNYAFEAINTDRRTWPAGWADLTLEYRAGTQMTSIPADFACVPGAAASSSLLAMSNYTQSAEPYYEYEHWYGLGTIHGEPHHVLIFPRATNGPDSAIIVVLDAGTDGTVQLDHDGTIHSQN